MNVQAYFQYDGKKSGGVTRSHLRQNVKEGGNVLIACDWEGKELEKNPTDKFKHDAAVKKIKLYTIDSTKITAKIQILVNSMIGDNIPVSAFIDLPNGTMPQGISKYEKRGIAVNVPV